jgi:probable rRNA maturation factor
VSYVSYTINVQNQHPTSYSVTANRLRQAANAALTQQQVAPNAALSIVITSDEAVQQLNQQHRGIDAPTDVLSFPAQPLPTALAAFTDTDTNYLGDLLLAYPYATAQARREGHDPHDSFALLVVHGVLHLLGYDHNTPAHKADMWAQQAAILRELGIDTGIVPALESSTHHDET